MKKGSKLRDTQYFLEIKDLQYKPIFLTSVHSLREAVFIASQHVLNMDNYAKVRREFREMDGAFSSVYFAPGKDKKSRHVFLLIQSYETPSEDEIQNQLDELDEVEKRIESGEIEVPDSV